MSDPFDRLRASLERLDVPDRWDVVAQRASAPEDVVLESPAPVRGRAGWLLAVAAVVAVVGVGAIAVVRSDADGTADRSTATVPDAVGVATTMFTVDCPTVSFEFVDVPPGRTGVMASGTIGRTGQVVPVDADVWLSRASGGAAASVLDEDFSSRPDADRIEPITIAGYRTRLLPPAMRGPGWNATFLFPGDEPWADGCNVWSLGSQAPDDGADVLRTYAEGLVLTDDATGPTITAPATSTPTPSTPTPSTPTPSTPPATTTPPSVPVVQRDAALDEWPPREPASATAAPTLLPADAIARAVRATGSAVADDGTGVHDAVQAYDDPDRDAYVVITTNLGQFDSTPLELRTAVDTTGWATRWDDAYTNRSADGFVNLALIAPGGVVTIHAHGVDRAGVLDLAASLVRRGDGVAGWEVPRLPSGMRHFASTGDRPSASRSVIWEDAAGTIVAELMVRTEGADALLTPLPAPFDEVDVNGITGIVVESAGRVAIVWSADEDTQIVFGYTGDRDTAISIARSIAPVSETEWNAAIDPPSGRDGCNSMFC